MVPGMADPSLFAITADGRREADGLKVLVDDGLLSGGGMDMLALPTAPVGPANSAKRLFLLLREALEEEILSRE